MMSKILKFSGMILREGIWIAIAAAVIFGGVLGFRYLGENREIVEAQPVERPITLVETSDLTPLTTPLPIRGEGFIKPFRQANLSAQSGGRIVELEP